MCNKSKHGIYPLNVIAYRFSGEYKRGHNWYYTQTALFRTSPSATKYKHSSLNDIKNERRSPIAIIEMQHSVTKLLTMSAWC